MDSIKKYHELVEEGKINPNENIKPPFPKTYREIYDDFLDEHGDPTNTTLFVDYLESIYKTPKTL